MNYSTRRCAKLVKSHDHSQEIVGSAIMNQIAEHGRALEFVTRSEL